MATNPSPNALKPHFTVESLTANATLTAAKTTRGDVTNAVKLLTAGDYGALLERLTALPNGVLAAATKLMLYRVRPEVSATVAHYVDHVLVSAYATEAATTIATKAAFAYDAATPLKLGPGEELWVGIAAAAANGIEVDAVFSNF